MRIATAIRDARLAAGLTQRELALLAGTSQTTISAYETGHKQPSVRTLERLLAVAGGRLTVSLPPRVPSPERLRENARSLEQVLALAGELPTRHERDLTFPRLVA